jgi:hypothetical protein
MDAEPARQSGPASIAFGELGHKARPLESTGPFGWQDGKGQVRSAAAVILTVEDGARAGSSEAHAGICAHVKSDCPVRLLPSIPEVEEAERSNQPGPAG